MNYHSQIGQDETVIKYYNCKTNGYFVEVGAFDGISLSNTYTLEQELHWSGLCIEPLPNQFEKLEKNRTCHCFQVACYDQDNLNLEFTDNDMLSGVSKDIDKHFSNKNKITINTKTLTSLLGQVKAPSFIEYLSIDTEGSEFHVLKGIDWSKYSFGYITIEHNEVEPRRSEMKQFLQNKGYSYHRANKFDDDYIKKANK